ncbi:MAG: MBL fold metallo-hydrolase [Bacteroidetes bacterium]|nr:MBL fold metallo-hydrolase [Bacteroidota bacterium]MBS1740979.1 MBL fold metallo-hydrolase [Bacteroidota bacterium]
MAIIFPLSEGEFTIGHDKVFHPFNPLKDELNDRPTGSLLVEIQPFLVVTENDIILLDTGLGFNENDGTLQIHHNIRNCGYTPEQVTKVLLSHLHKDHSGGAIHQNSSGIMRTSFPNAVYYIYRQEANDALQKGFPSYILEDIEPLLQSGQVHFLDGEQGDIDGYIKFWHSGGHCPGHIVYLIEDNSSKIFFGGDEAPQLKQMKIRYVAKYDYDGKKAMQLREQYAAIGKNEGWQFAFYHDVAKPLAIL